MAAGCVSNHFFVREKYSRGKEGGEKEFAFMTQWQPCRAAQRRESREGGIVKCADAAPPPRRGVGGPVGGHQPQLNEPAGKMAKKETAATHATTGAARGRSASD